MPKLPLLHPKQLKKVLEADGWTERDTVGSHLIMTKPGATRPVVIPLVKQQLSRDVLHSNLRTAKITRERLLELLKFGG